MIQKKYYLFLAIIFVISVVLSAVLTPVLGFFYISYRIFRISTSYCNAIDWNLVDQTIKNLAMSSKK